MRWSSEGGARATHAVASPSSDPGAAGRAKRPAKVYDLALKGGTGDKRELPRTDTQPFSMLGVSWTGAAKRLDGALAQVRPSLKTGQWERLAGPRTERRPAGEPRRRGARSIRAVVGRPVRRHAGAGHPQERQQQLRLPKDLEVNLVDPGC